VQRERVGHRCGGAEHGGEAIIADELADYQKSNDLFDRRGDRVRFAVGYAEAE